MPHSTYIKVFSVGPYVENQASQRPDDCCCIIQVRQFGTGLKCEDTVCVAASSPDTALFLAHDAGLPGSDPRQHRPHQDQRDLRPPGLRRHTAEERPRIDQPAGRHGDQEEESGQHQTQNPLHLQLHQREERAGNTDDVSTHFSVSVVMRWDLCLTDSKSEVLPG